MIKQRRGGGAGGGGGSQFVLPITNSNQHRNGVKPYYNTSTNKNPFRRMTGGGDNSSTTSIRRLIFVLAILVLVVVAFFVVLKGNNATVTTQHDYNIIQQQQQHKKQQRRTQEEIEHQLDKKRAFDQAKLASRDNNKKNEATAPSDITPPAEYKQFSTLYKAMQLSSLTLLYFAASWCPESAPTTQQLVEMFDSTDMDKTLNFSLLTQDDFNRNNKADVAIVYVSSDDSLEDMMDYGLKEKWIKVPFDEEENKETKKNRFDNQNGFDLERTRLKRHFHTCAKIEAEPYKIQRSYGIPHLVVLTNTGDILTQHALEDLKDYYPNAKSLIQHYQEMSNLATSLKDKFEDDLPTSAQHKGHKAVHDSVNPVTS